MFHDVWAAPLNLNPDSKQYFSEEVSQRLNDEPTLFKQPEFDDWIYVHILHLVIYI